MMKPAKLTLGMVMAMIMLVANSVETKPQRVNIDVEVNNGPTYPPGCKKEGEECDPTKEAQCCGNQGGAGPACCNVRGTGTFRCLDSFFNRDLVNNTRRGADGCLGTFEQCTESSQCCVSTQKPFGNACCIPNRKGEELVLQCFTVDF